MFSSMKIVTISLCIIFLFGCNCSFGQSPRPNKSAWDFELKVSPKIYNYSINSEEHLHYSPNFNVTITNTGIMPDQYMVGVTSTQGWPVVATNQAGTIVAPRATLIIFVIIVVPGGSPPTIGDVDVIVKSYDSPQKQTKEDHITIDFRSPVISVQSITVDPSNPTAGKEITIRSTLKNNGNYFEPHANVSFYVDEKPLALNVSAGRIDPGQTLNVTVKWTAVKGAHKIEAKCEHWFADDEYHIIDQTVNVGAASLTGNAGLDIGLAIFMGIILLIVIIIIIKRRKKKISGLQVKDKKKK